MNKAIAIVVPNIRNDLFVLRKNISQLGIFEPQTISQVRISWKYLAAISVA
jgi:hypothetical protein